MGGNCPGWKTAVRKVRWQKSGKQNTLTIGSQLRQSESHIMKYLRNHSEAKDNATLLWEFNHQMLIKHIPLMVFLTILFIVGSVGNTLSIYIFGCRLKPTTPNFLYTCLGVFDLLTCLLGIPLELVVTLLHYYYRNIILCKTTRYLMHVSSAGSCSTLLIIAIDRFLRVCRPLHPQINVHHAKIGVFATVVAGMILSIPAVFIFGNHTLETPVKGLTSVDCNVEDKYTHGLEIILYKVLLVLVLLFFTAGFAVLYANMWREIRACQLSLAKVHPSLMTEKLPPDKNSANESEDTICPKKAAPSSLTSLQISLHKKMTKTIKGRRLAWVAFAITLLFVFSYLPHVILLIFRTVIGGEEYHLRGPTFALFSICFRLYFLNSVGNVFIYSFMCSEFRIQCKRLIVTECSPRAARAADLQPDLWRAVQ